MLDKGLVQIYTGDGKGKTTAAVGLAVRAAGWGSKVLIYQFLKPASLKTGERLAVQRSFPGISFEAFDISWDMSSSFDDEKQVTQMKKAVREVLERIRQAAAKKLFNVIILDEIVFCFSKGLVDIEDIKNIIDAKDPSVEIVLTGRGATDELIELADLVTEMKNIKHPFDKGFKARQGIEY
jgi:cob(I)alamin adenosyltransferase